MKRRKAIVAYATIAAMLMPMASFAADGDVWTVKDDAFFAKANKATLDPTTRGKIGIAPEKYYYEYDGKLYKQTYVDTVFGAAADKTKFQGDLKPAEAVKPAPTTPGPEEPGEELKVVSVSAINKTGVDVKFEALAKALDNATIAVMDDKGAAVKVQPVNLVKGETEATFKFETALTVDPKGVWTVAGIKMDMDLTAKLKAVYDAENQVELLDALKKLELADLKDANIKYYQEQLIELKKTVAEEAFTKEQAQELVTKGNEKAVNGANEETVVKAVKEAKDEVTMLEALKPLPRVNPKWISAYYDAIKAANETDKDTVKEIQQLIDEVNKMIVADAAVLLDLDGQPSLKKEDLAKTKTLIEQYIKDDENGVTDKAEALRKINRQLAIADVVEATSPAQLSTAIHALKKVDLAFELDMKAFKAENRAAYIEKLKNTAANDKNTISEINGVLITVNAAAEAAPIKKIEDATGVDELLDALKKYSEAKYVADANKEFYWNHHERGTNNGTNKFATSGMDKDKVQKAIDEANLSAVKFYAKGTVAGINDGSALGTIDADKLYAALVAYGNDLKDLNIYNKGKYGAVEVGNDAAETGTTGLAATKTLGDISPSTATPANIQAMVTIANVEALKAQTNGEGVLSKLAIMSELKNVKAEYAAEYLTSVTGDHAAADPDIKDLDGTDATKARTIAVVQKAIDEINVAQGKAAGLKAVNEAKTAAELEALFDQMVVDKTITANSYLNLNSSDKLLVAGLFMKDEVFTAAGLVGAGRTTAESFGKYTDVADIGADLAALATAFDSLRIDTNDIFTGKPVGHTSITIAAVQAELAKLVKADYKAYDELSGVKKLKAAEEFIKAFPVNEETQQYLSGYATFNAYTAAVDAAIAK